MKRFKKISLILIVFMIFQFLPQNAFALDNNYSDYSIFIRDINALNYPSSITVSSSTKNANMATYNKYKLVVYGNLGEYSSKKDINGEYEYLGWNKNGQAQANSRYQDTGSGNEGFNQVTYVSTDMSGNSITTQALNSWKNVKYYVDYNLNEQLLYNGSSTGVNAAFIGKDKAIILQPATLISDGSVRVYFTSKDGSNKRYATLTIPAIPYKNITSCQINSDKNSYTMAGDKDDIDVNIGASAFVNPTSNNFTTTFIFGLTARVTSLEINGAEVASAYKVPPTFDDNYYGATTIQSFQVSTGLKTLNIKRSQLKEGSNTITLKGYASMETFNNLNDTVFGSKTFTITVDKKIISSLTGQILTDKSSYACKTTDTNVAIQAKEQTDLDITDITQVSEIGAKIISYNINGGLDIAVNKVKTGSSIKTIATDYAALNLSTSSLNLGSNTINIKGYSWFKDKLGNLKEVNTTKSVTITKSETSKPIAIIEAPMSTHIGNTVTVKGSGSDPSGLAIIEYLWTSSNGQTLIGTGGSIKIDSPVTLTLKVKNSANVWSDSVTHTINTQNEPPTVTISVPPVVYAGDDVYVTGYGQDKDGDTLQYNWSKPFGMYGNLTETFGVIYFMDLGIKQFGLTVSDSSGESASAAAQTNVIAPTPNVVVNSTGTFKENRKVTIDASSSIAGSKRATIDWTSAKWIVTPLNGALMNDVRIQKHTVGSTNGAILYDPSKGINNSLNGLSMFDMTFKKAGQYEVKCTLTNNFGISNTTTTTLNINIDDSPLAGFTVPTILSRDISNTSSGGLAQAIITTTDTQSGSTGNYSVDDDTIEKIAWFYIFDSNNNGTYLDDKCFVYNATTKLYQHIGTYSNIATFNLDSVPVGLLRTISLTTAHVGDYYFGVKVREAFGQEYIPQFINAATDKKTNIKFY